MLRRQMLRATRKPLVVMTPKSLLRHKLSVSTLDDLANGEFQHLIPDSHAPTPKKVTRVVRLRRQGLLRPARRPAEAKAIDDVAIVRIEQLYPFPRANCWLPNSSASPAPRKSSGARKSRRTRAPGTRSSTTCAACTARQARTLHYAGRARSRRAGLRPSANTHVAEAAETGRRCPGQSGPATTSSPNNPFNNTIQTGRLSNEPSKSKSRYCPNPFPTPPSPPGTRKPATRSRRDENLVDLETDKVVLEVPSPVDGVLKEIKFEEGATVTSQQVIAIIEEGAVAAAPAPAAAAPHPLRRAGSSPRPAASAAAAAPAAPAGTGRHRRPAAGRALRRSATKASIRPTSTAPAASGAVTKEDLVNYASGKPPGSAAPARNSACR